MLEYNLQFFADNGDKTEEPTSKKLDDARSEGQVAKSREIGNCLGLFVFFQNHSKTINIINWEQYYEYQIK